MSSTGSVGLGEAGGRHLAAAITPVLNGHAGTPETTARILRALADATETLGAVPLCRIEPFAPGRRSNVEQYFPGLGSSDGVALLTGGDPDANSCIILFDAGTSHPRLALEATIHWADDPDAVPLAGWDRRPIERDDRVAGALSALTIHPEIDFAPGDLGFAHGFIREAVVELHLRWDDVVVSGATTRFDVCDVRQLGSLYQRVLDRVVEPDTLRQAARWSAGDQRPGPIHHPWSPVLVIGMEKASLYTRALVDDIVAKSDHLADPRWLLRVGVYLEMLTCLGIFEAVRDQFDDLLSPDERAAFEQSDGLAEIRSRIDPAAWSEVWALRNISAPRLGMPRAGAVSALNLIQKKRATLAFLHTHHDDLKHAIELAGPNLHDAQESWQRVFRDAERAVLHKTAEVFPELEYLPAPMREVSRWQQQGVAGQQGLYPTACTQYRASMNDVARWSKDRGLMDYTGEECIPIQVSLLDAIMNDPDHVEVLERGDGYRERVDLAALASTGGGDESDRMLASFEALLSQVPILQLLSADELRELAGRSLPLLAVPGERIVVEGAEGDSLYVLADGEVEVLVRIDGRDRQVDTMGPGSVIGEMALLTGERRSATVRSIGTALILQIGKRQYEPIVRAHPEWLDDLAEMMDQRLRDRRARLARGQSPLRRRVPRKKTTREIRNQIANRFFAAA
jgi:CRP-like cAMP-binding protein